ncbi:MAG: hypothetical protein RLZZ316_5 [Bacteroidota bacterium]|jgi:hypothetical protein
MNTAAQIAYKNTLKQFCQSIIEQRIATARQAMAAAQEAANAEEKSSAGDKYETARAMGHLEKDMHAKQLAGYIKELSALNAINVNTIYTHSTAGACITTADAIFFIAAGLGKYIVAGILTYFLSPQSPLSKQLLLKKAGDTFILNNKLFTIEGIY